MAVDAMVDGASVSAIPLQGDGINVIRMRRSNVRPASGAASWFLDGHARKVAGPFACPRSVEVRKAAAGE